METFRAPKTRALLIQINRSLLWDGCESLGRVWDGFGTGRKVRIPNVYRPWDGWDG